MVYHKTNEEIEKIRESCTIVSQTLAELAKWIEPGISTIELDRLADDFIRLNNGIPSFKNYLGFPNSICISINDAVVHGIPNETKLKEGDLVSIDCGVLYNGYHGDSAFTFVVGEPSIENSKLLEITKKSLEIGIEKAIVGGRTGDIGWAIQQYVSGFGYGIVRDLVGHGVGRELHESPEIANYGRRGQGVKLLDGLVIAIEPMINSGTKNVYKDKDGWTIKTKDGSNSAHFEHTVVVRKGKAEILSSFEPIERVILKIELVH